MPEERGEERTFSYFLLLSFLELLGHEIFKHFSHEVSNNIIIIFNYKLTWCIFIIKGK